MCSCLHVTSTCSREFSSCVKSRVKSAACCPTRLSQHIGKADVWTQGRVHFHPGRHGVKLTVVVELIQKFLRENSKIWFSDNWYSMFRTNKTSPFCLCCYVFPWQGDFQFVSVEIHTDSLSPGRPLCFCVAVSSPWEESSVSLPPPPSPAPGCAPQSKWGHPLCPYL